MSVQLYGQSFGLAGVVLVDSTVDCPDLFYAGFVVIEDAVLSAVVSESIESAENPSDPDHWITGVTLKQGFQFWAPMRSVALTSGKVAMYKQDKTMRGYTR